MLPEGSKFCNECGATLASKSLDATASERKKWEKLEQNAYSVRMRNFAYEIGRLYKCRMAGLVLGIIDILMAAWLMILVVSTKEEEYYSLSEIFGDHSFFNYLSIALSIASIIVLIYLVMVLYSLKDYHAGFRVTFIAVLVCMAISIITGFVADGLLLVLFSTLETIAMLVYTCNLYSAMESVVRPYLGVYTDPQHYSCELGDRWNHLIKLYAIAFAVKLVARFISSFCSMDSVSYSVATFSIFVTLLGGAAMLMVFIIEVRLLKESWNSLERLAYSRNYR